MKAAFFKWGTTVGINGRFNAVYTLLYVVKYMRFLLNTKLF